MKILVILFKPIGDVLLGIKVVRGLHNKYPNSEIDFVTSASCVSLLEGNPDIKNVIIKNDYFGANMHAAENDYDRIIRLSAITSATSADLASQNGQKLIDWYAKRAGIDTPKDVDVAISMTEDDILDVNDYWEDLKSPEKVIGFSTNTEFGLAPDIELFNKLSEQAIKDGYSVVQLGLPSDKKIVTEDVVDLTTYISLKQNVEAIKRCSYFLSFDSIVTQLGATAKIKNLIFHNEDTPANTQDNVSNIDLMILPANIGLSELLEYKEERAGLSIIIPVFNLPEMTQNCIDSVIKSTKEPYEIILVDNGSTNEISDEYKAKVKYYKSEYNRMFAGGCNWGAEKAAYDNLCFLNNDTIVSEGWDKPLSFLLSADDIGMVGVKLLYLDNTIQHAGVEVISNAPEGSIFNHRYRYAPSDYLHANHIREYECVTGACIFLRKSDFNAVNGFTTEYLNSHEDNDLCYKLKFDLNKRIMYYPHVRIYHLETKTPRDSTNFAYAKNNVIFLEKWREKIFIDIGIWNNVDASEAKTGKKISTYKTLI